MTLWKTMSRTQDSFNLLRKTLTNWPLNYRPGTTLELAAWTDACSVICKRTGHGCLQNPVLALFKEKGQFWLFFSVSIILTDGTSSNFGKGNLFVGSKALTPWNVTASSLRRVCFAPFLQRHTIVYNVKSPGVFQFYSFVNLVPRVLSFPSPGARERREGEGTGRRGPWERGCAFVSANSEKALWKLIKVPLSLLVDMKVTAWNCQAEVYFVH